MARRGAGIGHQRQGVCNGLKHMPERRFRHDAAKLIFSSRDMREGFLMFAARTIALFPTSPSARLSLDMYQGGPGKGTSVPVRLKKRQCRF
jgi:hypothetical protein